MGGNGAGARRSDLYGPDTVPLPTAAEAAALDREAIEQFGIADGALMENAGRAAALLIQRLYPHGRVVGVVGSGNNGGDALVLLRTLAAWGREVAFVRAGRRFPKPAPLHGFRIAEVEADLATAAMASAAVLVDGILGTGAVGAPREPAATYIHALNIAGPPVVALDLPSGVDATTGAIPAEAVAADLTLSFGWPKLGLMFHPARAYCGRLMAAEIGLPPAADVGAELVTPAWATAYLPVRVPVQHKGMSGRLLIAAGRTGMAGAAALATEAAVRAGAGVVRIVSAGGNREILQSLIPDAIFRDRQDGDAFRDGKLDAALIGPGVGTFPEGRRIMERALDATAGLPTVLDADALTVLAEDPAALRELAADRPLVLTPHPVEFSRLTGDAVADIRAHPVAAARAYADDMGCTVLLKGQPSVIAAPGAPVLVNTTGSSDVAKAGMGDQLAGTIAAILAAGAPARVAAALGIFYAGRAADLAACGRSLSPRDVSAHLAAAFADPGAEQPPLDLPFITFDQPRPR